jgi:hypothetical protein
LRKDENAPGAKGIWGRCWLWEFSNLQSRLGGSISKYIIIPCIIKNVSYSNSGMLLQVMIKVYLAQLPYIQIILARG